jgi:thioredoxin 1
MAMQITDANFNELLNGEKPLVVDFWAEWCGPCKMIAPFLDELAVEYEGKVIVGKVNVDENEELPAEYKIRSIPTILFFKGGELVDKLIGAVSKEVLKEKIEALGI